MSSTEPDPCTTHTVGTSGCLCVYPRSRVCPIITLGGRVFTFHFGTLIYPNRLSCLLLLSHPVAGHEVCPVSLYSTRVFLSTFPFQFVLLSGRLTPSVTAGRVERVTSGDFHLRTNDGCGRQTDSEKRTGTFVGTEVGSRPAFTTSHLRGSSSCVGCYFPFNHLLMGFRTQAPDRTHATHNACEFRSHPDVRRTTVTLL